MADDKVQTPGERVIQLESLLTEQAEAHAAQKKRADALEKTLATKATRLEKLEAAAAEGRELRATIQRVSAERDGLAARVRADSEGDYVSLDGQVHPIIGVFRADNTFTEVKRGHCDEGVTLVAIPKVF